MAITNPIIVTALQKGRPHTFNATTKLVMAMADCTKNAGKKTWLGRDKGVESYAKFHDRLRESLFALDLDGLVTPGSDARAYREAILNFLDAFAVACPNWQDAYFFADLYFRDNPESSIQKIDQLLRGPGK